MSSEKRSIVWSCFKKTSENSNLAECVFCKAQVGHCNTSNLLGHLRSKHRRVISQLWSPESNHAQHGERMSPSMKQILVREANSVEIDSDLTDLSPEEASCADAPSGGSASPDKQEPIDDGDSKVTKLDSAKSKRCRSVVWMCFEKSANEPSSAICTLCGRSIRQLCGSTSNLLKHLLNKHPLEYESIVSEQAVTVSCETFHLETHESSVIKCVKNKRRSRSVLWHHFFKNSASADEVLCSFCGRMLKQPVGSTSNLIKHLHAKHRDEYNKLFPGEDLPEDFDSPPLKMMKTEAVEETDGNVSLENHHGFELFHAEQKDDDQHNRDIQDMCGKVKTTWVKHCSDQEEEFAQFMTTKQKEILNIHKSIQELQDQLAHLTNEMLEKKLKRREELDRQAQMDLKFFTANETNARSQQGNETFNQICVLLEASENHSDGSESTATEPAVINSESVDVWQEGSYSDAGEMCQKDKRRK